jgi:Na+/H+-dicarboxylate symporter
MEKTRTIKIGLLGKIVLAIAVGIITGLFFPEWPVRIFLTLNGIFGEFLGFAIPLIILGLVSTAIADIGTSAGKMLLITVAIAYGSTILAGSLSYLTGAAVFPSLIDIGAGAATLDSAVELDPYFSVDIPAVMNVMTALVLAFVLGLGMSTQKGKPLNNVAHDFEQTKKNGVSEDVAGFTVPLCATIHMSGSMLKIVACALALMIMNDMPHDFGMFFGFICMLGITMVAAPGVPGGAIMAALGVLQSMLGFDQEAQALMIALYIAMDSFGTACNVTGDGAIAIIIDKIRNR